MLLQNIYSHALSEAEYVKNNVVTNSSGVWIVDIVHFLRMKIPWVLFISIFIGILICLLIKKNPLLRKRALFTFIVGIPIGYVAFVYIFALIVAASL